MLADRVTAAEAALYAGALDDYILDEALILDLHCRICGDLVPVWAGRWRDVEVKVGRLQPPLPFHLPLLMRDYVLDLQARWSAAATGSMADTLEFLAFAEGRFLTIHPFRDFNGRTIRLLMTELLRRLDLPRVTLAAQGAAARATYFAALEAADRFDWEPLMVVWNDRFSSLSEE